MQLIKRNHVTFFRNGGNLFQTIFGGSVRPEGDKELLREKCLSVLFHIQNKHKWKTGKRFKKCSQRRLAKKEVKSKRLVECRLRTVLYRYKTLLQMKIL